MQQKTFVIIVAKGEIAHNEQLLHLQQQFQLFSIILLSFVGTIYVLYLMVSKSVIEIIVAKGEIAHNEESWFAFTTIIVNTFQLSYFYFIDLKITWAEGSRWSFLITLCSSSVRR